MPQQPDAVIAVVGMTGRFPGARNLHDFWRNLSGGVESITFLPNQAAQESDFVPATAYLDDIELFDAEFFGITPHEATIMDPQHRVFLECAWEALESAGYNPETYPEAIGVYAGATINTYLLFHLAANPAALHNLDPLQINIGNAGDFLTTRVSYKLNLKGPSHLVQSACSTSLVAVHIACQSLLNQECDMALAGGISINLGQRAGYRYTEGGMVSPDGHCRAFDAAAQGTIFGSGVGIVVLKRLADALADGDCIHAVIRGSAINNDGGWKVGYTAPSVDGQAQVITEALANAGINSETIGYIEAHGTGTPLGDPIEIQALTKAFRARTEKSGFCALGSLKTNIGHLDAAAGVAGLIKAILALKHRQLPPSLHFTTPNPNIDFARSPFYVNAALADWPAGSGPRRAGVSSFGVGGTNAHLVLEEAPLSMPTPALRPWHLLVLSARSHSALDQLGARLRVHLHDHPDIALADVAYTLQVGRKAFGYRQMVVCREAGDALAALDQLGAQQAPLEVQTADDRSVVFMFPGQGSQHVDMAQALYRHEPTFREHIDRCAELLRPHLGLDLRDVLYPREQRTKNKEQSTDQPDPSPISNLQSPLDQTQYAQPALFVVGYALAQLWMEWGIHPQVMIGHSVGEYLAACLAGVFSLEDGLALVAMRGRMMQQLDAGTMLAVPLSEDEIGPLLDEGLSLAAVNLPTQCVVAGPPEMIAALDGRLAEMGLVCRRLHTSHAFHSAMMDPIVEPFVERLRMITLQPPRIPFISNVSGTWITADEATDPRYWAKHLREPVRFSDGVRELLQEPGRVLLEVGPGQSLSRLVMRHPRAGAERVVLPSLAPRPGEMTDTEAVLTALGRLWVAGVPIAWAGLHRHAPRQRVMLPTYPFERRRYWVEADPQSDAAPQRPAQPDTGLEYRRLVLYSFVEAHPAAKPVAARRARHDAPLADLFGCERDQRPYARAASTRQPERHKRPARGQLPADRPIDLYAQPRATGGLPRAAGAAGGGAGRSRYDCSPLEPGDATGLAGPAGHGANGVGAQLL